MRQASARSLRFVRALLPQQQATDDGAGLFRVARGDRVATLPAAEVKALVSDGVLSATKGGCRAAPEAVSWLRRQLAESDPHACQHQQRTVTSAGRTMDLSESPLSRLALTGPGESTPFLAPHQVEAGERFRRLVERAQLRPRTTMSYDLARTAGKGRGFAVQELGDLAADARSKLAVIATVLPRDCGDVLMDVCGLSKGLQLVETERRWPRRSAKLVLRIGLEQLAAHFGLSATAVGPQAHQRHWMDEGARPELFGWSEL